ncbi:MAG: DUF1244 domain-containing protein [Pseudomonadota bacterium]
MNDSSQDPLPDPSPNPSVEAAVLRRLLAHLATRTDVQNIELMTLAGFCRNCLAKWYAEEAGKLGQALSVDDAKTRVYGMPYNEWKAKFQREMP